MKIAEKILEYSASNKSVKNTSTDKGHYHQYRVDTAGNGATTFTSEGADGHLHEIKNYQVAEVNGHSHSIEVKEEQEAGGAGETRSFKTKYGFEHWFNKIENKRGEEKKGPVEVAGKRYGSPDAAARDLLRRQ